MSDVAERSAALAIACSRCERAGRYRLDTLIETYGAAFTVPLLLRVLSASCPKHESLSAYDLCGIHCLDLPSLFNVPKL